MIINDPNVDSYDEGSEIEDDDAEKYIRLDHESVKGSENFTSSESESKWEEEFVIEMNIKTY